MLRERCRATIETPRGHTLVEGVYWLVEGDPPLQNFGGQVVEVCHFLFFSVVDAEVKVTVLQPRDHLAHRVHENLDCVPARGDVVCFAVDVEAVEAAYERRIPWNVTGEDRLWRR